MRLIQQEKNKKVVIQEWQLITVNGWDATPDSLDLYFDNGDYSVHTQVSYLIVIFL